MAKFDPKDPVRLQFEVWFARAFPGTSLARKEFDDDGAYEALDVRMAWAAWCEQEKRRCGRGRFAGWFSELPSGMSYRLWQQGGAEPNDGDIALYE